jgi:3-isopropylmalate/(R)-2-methylmalate dehydratase small subunit
MGRVFKFGDNIDTDAIIPARYLVTTDPAELGKHCMEAADAEFAAKVRTGDFIVAGANFGCGSSREHAPVSIKAAGAACVIAKSFARIFLRNSINIGLPVIECPEAAAALRAGDEIEVNAETGEIKAKGGAVYRAKSLPGFIQEIVRAGGLMQYVSNKLKKGQKGE